MKGFKGRVCFFGSDCYSGTLRNSGLPSLPLWVLRGRQMCVGAAGGEMALLVDIENAGQMSAMMPLEDPFGAQMLLLLSFLTHKMG